MATVDELILSKIVLYLLTLSNDILTAKNINELRKFSDAPSCTLVNDTVYQTFILLFVILYCSLVHGNDM